MYNISKSLWIIRDLTFSLEEFDILKQSFCKGEISKFTDKDKNEWKGLITYIGRCFKTNNCMKVEKIKMYIIEVKKL